MDMCKEISESATWFPLSSWRRLLSGPIWAFAVAAARIFIIIRLTIIPSDICIVLALTSIYILAGFPKYADVVFMGFSNKVAGRIVQ